MEKSLEEGHANDATRPVLLRWQLPRTSRRRWWMFLAALAAVVFLFGFGKPKYVSHRSEALLDTVMNETLGFQKIFVLNLKSQSDRKDKLLLAAAMTGIKVEFMEAITLDEVNWKAIPPIDSRLPANISSLGGKVFASWRSHVNAMQAIVDQNLGSALILEDDADWDVRIKDQLRDWALTSRQLVQPLQDDPTQYLDPTYFKMNSTQYNQPMPADLNYTEWEWTNPPARTLQPKESAYGDLNRWDVLWLGHCGQRFAMPGTECDKTPLGRVTRHDDETVAETQYFRNNWSGNEYRWTYENHTRVTHWSCAQVCNTAYAVSNQGAKKLLYDFGIHRFRGMSDTTLREVCDGKDPFDMRTCLSVSPPLFNQYNIERDRSFAHTANIRMSANGNLRKMVNGEQPLREWFPDQEPSSISEDDPVNTTVPH